MQHNHFFPVLRAGLAEDLAADPVANAPVKKDQLRADGSGGTEPCSSAVDFRILGAPDAPAILSLIDPDGDRYADYTYDGSSADLDVSHGGLNLRPLDGTSSVNVWSMAGNSRFRVGSRNFRQLFDFWHSGANAHVRSTKGSIVIESPLEVKSPMVFRGDTSITGIEDAAHDTRDERERLHPRSDRLGCGSHLRMHRDERERSTPGRWRSCRPMADRTK